MNGRSSLRRRRAVRVALAALLCASSIASARAQADGAPRYLPAMRSELEAMELEHHCEARSAVLARCTLPYRVTDRDEPFRVRLVYSDETDTVYMYVERLVECSAKHERVPALLRQLMELNWTSLAAKYEWNPDSGEVRLSAVMHTDSNFDRRAFRSVLRTLLRETSRHWPLLQRTLDPGAGPPTARRR